jgi:hypothetical protein
MNVNEHARRLMRQWLDGGTNAKAISTSLNDVIFWRSQAAEAICQPRLVPNTAK